MLRDPMGCVIGRVIAPELWPFLMNGGDLGDLGPTAQAARQLSEGILLSTLVTRRSRLVLFDPVVLRVHCFCASQGGHSGRWLAQLNVLGRPVVADTAHQSLSRLIDQVAKTHRELHSHPISWLSPEAATTRAMMDRVISYEQSAYTAEGFPESRPEDLKSYQGVIWSQKLVVRESEFSGEIPIEGYLSEDAEGYFAACWVQLDAGVPVRAISTVLKDYKAGVRC